MRLFPGGVFAEMHRRRFRKSPVHLPFGQSPDLFPFFGFSQEKTDRILSILLFLCGYFTVIACLVVRD